jgi:hypothetical protein
MSERAIIFPSARHGGLCAPTGLRKRGQARTRGTGGELAVESREGRSARELEERAKGRQGTRELASGFPGCETTDKGQSHCFVFRRLSGEKEA